MRSLLIAATFFLLALAPLSAAEPEEGILQGQLANGTEGGSSVADQTVTLKIYLNDAETSSTNATTDSEGFFEFGGLSTDPSYSYEVSVNYQGADYFSEKVSFGENETSTFIGLMVYDSTTSDEAIKVVTSHTVIYVQEGSLQVGEFVGFLNDEDKTYIGSREVGDGKMETLHFTLPPKAYELQYGMGLMSCCAYPTDNGFIDTMAVEPGSKWIAFTYRLKPLPSRYVFTKTIDYPTDSLDILINGPGVQAVSDQLLPQGVVEIEGEEFLRLTGTGFAPNSQIEITISGLPGGSIQETFKWAAIGLGVLVLSLGLGYPLLRRRAKPVAVKPDLDSERTNLLLELAHLDDQFEAGGISENEYQRIRAQKKGRLIELLHLSQGKRHKGA